MTLMLLFAYREESLEKILIALVSPLIIISISILAKKITANKLEINIENKIWNFKRYGLNKDSEFKKPIPLGLILPLLLSFLSAGIIKFFAFLQFESRALPSKVTKKYGKSRFSTVLDWDDALIAFYGIIPLLCLALISKFISTSYSPFQELSRLAFYYTLPSLIPFGQLDGMKLFMGSRNLYILALILFAIAGAIVLI